MVNMTEYREFLKLVSSRPHVFLLAAGASWALPFLGPNRKLEDHCTRSRIL